MDLTGLAIAIALTVWLFSTAYTVFRLGLFESRPTLRTTAFGVLALVALLRVATLRGGVASVVSTSFLAALGIAAAFAAWRTNRHQ